MLVISKPPWATVSYCSSPNGPRQETALEKSLASVSTSSQHIQLSVQTADWFSHICPSVWLYIAIGNFSSVRLMIQNPLQIQRENGWLLHEENPWLCEANTFRGEIRRVTSSVHHSLARPTRHEAGTEVLLFPTLLEPQSALETVCCQYLLSPCPQHRGYHFSTTLASRVSGRCCCYCYYLAAPGSGGKTRFCSFRFHLKVCRLWSHSGPVFYAPGLCSWESLKRKIQCS